MTMDIFFAAVIIVYRDKFSAGFTATRDNGKITNSWCYYTDRYILRRKYYISILKNLAFKHLNALMEGP